jgi:predicted NAD/FAD-dependent oxidoreductase
MAQEVAIVGAGVAGAGAAYALRDAGASVTVFEKSGGVCGRAATRRKNGCTYDHGANYVKADSDRVAALLTDHLDTDGLVDVDAPVWTFDAAGEVSEGRDVDDHKWTYSEGITQLGKRLFDAADATVERRTRIAEPIRESGSWRLVDDQEADCGQFDALLVTPPAPQTADLLGAANWEHALKRDLRQAIAVVPYRTIITAVLHYPFEVDRPYYGLVNTDTEHDVGWLSREECKDGHVPDGESLLIAQMSPDWSVEHYEDPDGAIVETAAQKVATLLGDERFADPDWTDTQHWRYAQPDEGVDRAALETAADHDLFFAGDWVADEGRVHLALETGLDAGERIADHLA